MKLDELYDLSAYCNPVWSVNDGVGGMKRMEPLALDEVALFYRNKWFKENSFNDCFADEYVWTREEHIARIAYLAHNGWPDPIEMWLYDDGSKNFNLHVEIEGNHRLAAAIWLEEEYIMTQVAVSVDNAYPTPEREVDRVMRWRFPDSWRRFKQKMSARHAAF